MTNLIPELYRLYKKRTRSPEDYVEFQSFQARKVIDDFKDILEISSDVFLVDFGCGNGGYTEVFAQHFEKVLGIDYHVEPTVEERQASYLSNDLVNLELADKPDVIFCASVVEHVPDPAAFIASYKADIIPELSWSWQIILNGSSSHPDSREL